MGSGLRPGTVWAKQRHQEHVRHLARIGINQHKGAHTRPSQVGGQLGAMPLETEDGDARSTQRFHCRVNGHSQEVQHRQKRSQCLLARVSRPVGRLADAQHLCTNQGIQIVFQVGGRELRQAGSNLY